MGAMMLMNTLINSSSFKAEGAIKGGGEIW